MRDPGEVTEVLKRLGDGDRSAFDQLLELVYRELRVMADRQMRKERPDHTLQATALVNEAYLKLFGSAEPSFQNRRHFFDVAARAMRQILVDHARGSRAKKRGGGWVRQNLEGLTADTETPSIDLLALDEALTRLADRYPRRARVVELRYFGGLQNNEVCDLLEVDIRTVERDWVVAQAWLHRELSRE